LKFSDNVKLRRKQLIAKNLYKFHLPKCRTKRREFRQHQMWSKHI